MNRALWPAVGLFLVAFLIFGARQSCQMFECGACPQCHFPMRDQSANGNAYYCLWCHEVSWDDENVASVTVRSSAD